MDHELSEETKQNYLIELKEQKDCLQPKARYRLVRAITYEGDGAWLSQMLSMSIPDMGTKKCGDGCTISANTLCWEPID